MSYTTDEKVRYYIDARGSGADGFGTSIVGTSQMAINIADSNALIDMKLSKRYSVPFVTTPPVIDFTSKVMSAWRSLRSVYSGEVPKALEFVKDDYDKAMSWLDQLQEGDVDLPSSSGTAYSGAIVSEKATSDNFWSSKSSYFPVFELDSDLDWRVDPDLVDNIGSNR